MWVGAGKRGGGYSQDGREPGRSMAFILREHSHNEASNCEPSPHHRPSFCRAWRPKGKKAEDKEESFRGLFAALSGPGAN